MFFISACGAPGTADACQGLAAGDLVITEMMIDPDGTDTGGEWIELFNHRLVPLELKGLTLFTQDVDGTKDAAHVFRAGELGAHGYFVAGDVRASANPQWIDYSYASDLGALGNSRGVVGVRCGTTVLDSVRWSAPAKAGLSRMLSGGATPDARSNDLEANWCDSPATEVYLAPNAGTPKKANPTCLIGPTGSTCLDDGGPRALEPPGPGDLLITEVMASPSGPDATQEWFEVLARTDVDLNGLIVTTGSGAEDTIDSPGCLAVHAGAYALFARSADSFLNGGLPSPTALFSLSLSGTNERLALRRGDAGIDEVALLASASGKAWELAPTRLDALLNDDPASFCHAPRRWSPDGGSDFGSPGAANPPCEEGGPAVDAGPSSRDECLDPQSRRLRALRRPCVGDLVITEWMPNPAAVTDDVGEYFEIRVNKDLDLNDLELGDSSTATRTLKSADCLSAAAGSYLVFAASGDAATNGGLPRLAGVMPFGLGNTADSIWVRGADGGLLDSVSYTASVPGQSTQLRAGLTHPADNDLAMNLCFTPDAGLNRYGAGDFGTPGKANVACP